jgi:hypothetical protein
LESPAGAAAGKRERGSINGAGDRRAAPAAGRAFAHAFRGRGAEAVSAAAAAAIANSRYNSYHGGVLLVPVDQQSHLLPKCREAEREETVVAEIRTYFLVIHFSLLVPVLPPSGPSTHFQHPWERLTTSVIGDKTISWS